LGGNPVYIHLATRRQRLLPAAGLGLKPLTYLQTLTAIHQSIEPFSLSQEQIDFFSIYLHSSFPSSIGARTTYCRSQRNRLFSHFARLRIQT
ncbi:MAG: hypothetical protein K2Q23_19765, partial [Bryobacteraceae bacterium]|nr:hypothetical protein [Bryobacteraceae bacterium]